MKNLKTFEKYSSLKVSLDDKKQMNIKLNDEVLGGKFKNKKIKVKKIDINAKGDITINDKPFLKFRTFESFKLNEYLINNNDDKVRTSYKNMLSDINQSLFGLSGLRVKLAFMLKSESNPDRLKKLKECLDYIIKIQESFKNSDFTLNFKQYYKNVDSYVKLIYQTLKYVMPIIKFFNIQGLENIDKSYREYVNLINSSHAWQTRLPDYLKN